MDPPIGRAPGVSLLTSSDENDFASQVWDVPFGVKSWARHRRLGQEARSDVSDSVTDGKRSGEPDLKLCLVARLHHGARGDRGIVAHIQLRW
jgi:hypothetical protein